MSAELKLYLRNLAARLRLEPSSEREIVRELTTHLEDRAQELCQEGATPEEAARLAFSAMGPPQLLAKQFYEAYSQGSWRWAFLAALPHSIFALFFALHLWRNLGWLMLFFVAILGMAFYGWRHGKPAWLFPWLGYLLLLVLGVGLFLLSLPLWAQVVILAYIPLAWWLLTTVAVQAVKRDWLYGSMVLLPFPVILGWVLALRFQGRWAEFVRQGHNADPWIALSFLTLAVAAATFIRLRQRLFKTGALLTPELLILILVTLSTQRLVGYIGFTLLTLLALGLLLSPALLEHRIGHGEGKPPEQANALSSHSH